jgi:hypothetical protein
MQKLAEHGLVAAIQVFAQSPPDVTHPLCTWSPGEPLPHAGRISYRAKKRYRNKTPKHMTAYVPTNRALRLYGVSARGANDRPAVRFKPAQTSHDLGLSAVFTEHHSRWPADSFIGEDLFEKRGHGEKVEDALVLGPEREPLLAIDFLAQYGPARITALSKDLADREIRFWFF